MSAAPIYRRPYGGHHAENDAGGAKLCAISAGINVVLAESNDLLMRREEASSMTPIARNRACPRRRLDTARHGSICACGRVVLARQPSLGVASDDIIIERRMLAGRINAVQATSNRRC